MAQPSVLNIVQYSLIGRLVEFIVVVWENSLLARALGKLGELWRFFFNNSYVGAVWYSNWPSAEALPESRIGRVVLWLGDLFSAVSQRVSPWLTSVWDSSLIARLARWGYPILENSYLFQAFTGFASDVELAPAETGRRTTAPEVYLLGAVLGLAPVLPSGTNLLVAGIWGVALFWLVRKVAVRDFSWRASSAFVPLLFFLVIAASAVVQSAARSASLLSFILWITAGLLFFMVVNIVRNSRDAAVLAFPS